MAKSLILAVNIGYEMLGALGQVELGIQVNNRRRCSPYRGILLRQELEII
jgi:hypothetical protein